MDKSQNRKVHIRISGNAGAGKTRLLHLLGKFLEDNHYPVQCFDEVTKDSPEGTQVAPKYPEPWRDPYSRPSITLDVAES